MKTAPSQDMPPVMLPLRFRKQRSFGEIFGLAALIDELSTECDSDSSTTSLSTASLSTAAESIVVDPAEIHVPEPGDKIIHVDLHTTARSDALEPGKKPITARSVAEDRELFAEFQLRLRESQSVGTISARCTLGEFIKEKNACASNTMLHV